MQLKTALLFKALLHKVGILSTQILFQKTMQSTENAMLLNSPYKFRV
jgi:hypothetical protein